jgi:hypothetical protein
MRGQCPRGKAGINMADDTVTESMIDEVMAMFGGEVVKRDPPPRSVSMLHPNATLSYIDGAASFYTLDASTTRIIVCGPRLRVVYNGAINLQGTPFKVKEVYTYDDVWGWKRTSYVWIHWQTTNQKRTTIIHYTWEGEWIQVGSPEHVKGYDLD